MNINILKIDNKYIYTVYIGKEVIDTESKSMDTINVSIADYAREYFQRVFYIKRLQ